MEDPVKAVRQPWNLLIVKCCLEVVHDILHADGFPWLAARGTTLQTTLLSPKSSQLDASAGQGDTNGASNNTGSFGDMQDVNSPLQGALRRSGRPLHPFSVNVVKVSEFIFIFGFNCTQVHLVLVAIAIEMTMSEL